jgi:hypothetical protein
VVDIVKREEDFVLYGVNEYLTPKTLTLRYGSFSPDGREGAWQELTVTLTANASTVIATLPAIPEGHIPCAMLIDEQGEVVARRRFVEKPYHTLGLPKPEITVEIADGVATYTCHTFALGVCLDLDGDDAGLSDNFFDLYPGVPYRVKLGKVRGEVKYVLMR